MIVAVMAMVATAAVAQSTYGVKAGVNFASGSGDDFDGTDGRTSLVLGGFAKFMVSEKFAFQPELLYSMQGVKGEGDIEGMPADLTMKFDYLNVPLMGKYYLSDGFSLQAGPQLGFLMSAKAKAEAQGEEVEVSIKDEVKGFDFGINIGLGYDANDRLGFDLRYNIGLTPIPDYDGADGKNRVVQITASYSF